MMIGSVFSHLVDSHCSAPQSPFELAESSMESSQIIASAVIHRAGVTFEEPAL